MLKTVHLRVAGSGFRFFMQNPSLAKAIRTMYEGENDDAA